VTAEITADIGSENRDVVRCYSRVKVTKKKEKIGLFHINFVEQAD